MRLYSFKKNLLTQRMARHDFASMNLRFAAFAAMVTGVIFLNPAAHAEDPIEIAPTTNPLEILAKPKATVKKTTIAEDKKDGPKRTRKQKS